MFFVCINVFSIFIFFLKEKLFGLCILFNKVIVLLLFVLLEVFNVWVLKLICILFNSGEIGINIVLVFCKLGSKFMLFEFRYVL